MTYFPAFNGEADCGKCELVDWSDGLTYGKSNCHSYGKSQRNKRDFEYTSGRCPKIPDRRGFVHESQRENQREAYPLVHAESNGEDIFLRLSLPGKKRMLRVYETRSGFFYFNTRDESGGKIKRILFIGCNNSRSDIMGFLEWCKTDYCIFDCEISDSTV